MRKKKRSAAQLRNDRRLGRMAKARAKAKRGGRRKAAKRKNPHRKVAGKRRIKRVIKKAKAISAKSHLQKEWNIFKCYGKQVRYLGLTTAGKLQWTIRDAAIIWKSKDRALKVAKKIAKRRDLLNYQVGVANRETSVAQVAAQCKAGKA